MQKINKLVKTYKPVSNHATNIAHAKKMKAEGKKSRDDKDRVHEMLFALFEKHQYYNIKDLVRETRQPVTYLKTILNEVLTGFLFWTKFHIHQQIPWPSG